MKHVLPVALALVLAVAPGCLFARERANRPIDEAAVGKLAAGDSAARVVELLGAPTDVVQLGRRSAYRYDFTQKKRTGLWLILVGFLNDDTRQDRVWVFLDVDERVSHVGTTFQGDEPEFAMPWSDVE